MKKSYIQVSWWILNHNQHVVSVKSMVKISSNFVAFLENTNFTQLKVYWPSTRKPLLTKNCNFYELYVLKNRSFYELLNRVNSCTIRNCWPNGRGSPKICISNDTKSNVTFGLNELWSLKSLFVNLFCSVVKVS